MKRPLLWFALALPLLLGALLFANAQVEARRVVRPPIGIEPPIWPRPPVWLPPIQQVLRVESVNVSATITDGVAQTDVEQIFRNDSERPQEGVYLFPVPEGATLSDFALYDGDKKMTARLLDKDEASQTYEGIVSRLRDPALLQYVGRNTYEVRLFPVPPHATRKITLRYAEALRPEAGGARRYVYSFVADSMGGTQRTSAPPAKTTVRVTVQDDAPLANVYSPLPGVSVRHTSDRTATVTWEADNERVRGDFILYYGTARRDPVGLSLLAYNVSLPRARTAAFTPGLEGKRDSGYFLLMASPKTELADAQILPKRVVLVLDRSGSMAGPKIEQARGALAYVLQRLRPGDRFNVMTFNESNDILSSDGLLTATQDNIRRGLAFVKDIQAEGGTNIYDALDAALKMFPAKAEGDGRQNMVIFLTDGLPTVGNTDQSQIVEYARTLSRAAGVRLFDFGVGYDVDVHFLDRLAQQNKGDSDYVRPEEDIEAKVSRFYEKVASPVLTDVGLEINGVRTADVYPRPSDLPDLFAGSQLLIAGRYVGDGPVTARLTGDVNGRPVSYALSTTLPAVADADDFLPRLWATRKIGYLLDAIRLRQTEASGGDDKELVDEVVRLSKEYGVLTPYTSFLVTDEGENIGGPVPVMGGGPVHRVFRSPALGTPGISGGGGYPGGGFGGALAGPALFGLSQGAAATTQSQTLRAARKAGVAQNAVGFDSLSADRAAQERVRAVGAKTFFLRVGVWTDSAYDPAKKEPVTVVRAFSPAHFALLRAVPDLAAYSSLGDNVLIVLDSGHVLRLAPDEGATSLTPEALKALAGG
ncbi:MAG: VWA domain-containing protein [Armatimonadetes bacterium]|nr:VWA domain-containing protein [Armatimonadota bacterium]